MENWLITGGCGFIGRNLVELLGSKPDIGIRVLDNFKVCGANELATVCDIQIVGQDAAPPKKGTVQLMRGDIINPEDAKAAARNMDVIAHLAANTGVPNSVENPEMDFKNNVEGVFNMLRAAKDSGTRRFIFASSGAPTGNTPPPIVETSPVGPVSPYGASKLAGEGYCSAWNHCYGLETAALRFSNVYGPHSLHKTSVVAKFINAALAGEDWTIFGDGAQTRDFLYVGDLVNAIWLAAATPGIGGEIFQIATGIEHSLNDMSQILRQALQKTGLGNVASHGEPPRLGDILRNYANPAKAQKLLGWKAEMPLQKGLELTAAWFCAQKASNRNMNPI